MISFLLAACLSATVAHAQPAGEGAAGVLVRLEPGGQAITDDPVVTLTPPSGGEALRVELADDGEAPDVSAADGRWAGGVLTAHASFTVQLTMGDKTLDGGTVEWDSEARARDLVLTLTGDSLLAQASSPQQNAPPSGVADPSTPATGAPVGGPGAVSAATVPPSGLPPVSDPSKATAADDGWLWMALGIGALSLVGGLLLVLRGGGSSKRSGARLERAPEPPIFGPSTPSLSRGLTLWTVPEADRERFVAGLVGAVAARHRVLLILPQGAPAPAVYGGPVHVSRESAPRKIEDQLADLEDQPGLPLVVVAVVPEPDARFVQSLAEMMEPDPGAILVATTAPSQRSADFTVTVDGERARLSAARGSVSLVETPHGYKREDG